jgi:hypothetical protein
LKWPWKAPREKYPATVLGGWESWSAAGPIAVRWAGFGRWPGAAPPRGAAHDAPEESVHRHHPGWAECVWGKSEPVYATCSPCA